MIKEYIIAVQPKGELKDLSYFLGEGDGTTQIPRPCWSNESFHIERIEMTKLLFTTVKENARVMTSKNMRSWIERILEQMPYWTIEIEAILIFQVNHEVDK